MASPKRRPGRPKTGKSNYAHIALKKTTKRPVKRLKTLSGKKQRPKQGETDFPAFIQSQAAQAPAQVPAPVKVKQPLVQGLPESVPNYEYHFANVKDLGRNSKLGTMPHDIYVNLMTRIKLGAFPHIAAASLGIPINCFKAWMRRGELKKGRIYRAFYLDVCQAMAEARISREIHVAEHMPLEWLKLGPGKTTRTLDGERLEGWTDTKIEEKNITQDVRIEEVQKAEAMADALQHLADLGIVSITQTGQEVFNGLPAPDESTGTIENLTRKSETGENLP